MYKTINIFGLHFKLVEFIFVSIIFAIPISLGNWQLERLSKKNHFIESINTSIKNSPIILDKSDTSVKHYTKIEIEGNFIKDKNIFLYGRRSACPEKDGYYLLSPFKTIHGDIFLVSRGWIAHSSKSKFIQYQQQLGNTKIVGIALPHEKRNFFVPKNDQRRKIWFTIDLAMAKESMGINVTNFYLMQLDSKDLPEGGKSLSATNLNKVRNNHMEYAITWYSLAVSIIILFVVYGRVKNIK